MFTTKLHVSDHAVERWQLRVAPGDRDDVLVSVLAAHPAGPGIRRRVRFRTANIRRLPETNVYYYCNRTDGAVFVLRWSEKMRLMTVVTVFSYKTLVRNYAAYRRSAKFQKEEFCGTQKIVRRGRRMRL